jgi:uncharacterized protein
VNKSKPRVMIEEKTAGGIIVEGNGHKVPDRNEIIAILNETGVYNGKIIFYNDMNADELVALLLENAVYTKGIVAINKIDLVDKKRVDEIRKEVMAKTGMKVIGISAVTGANMDELKSLMFDNLSLTRIYLKPKDSEVDFSKPLIVKDKSTIMEVAKGLHSKAAKNLKCAYITGKSVKFSNQRVGGEHVVQDGDIVTLIYDKF